MTPTWKENAFHSKCRTAKSIGHKLKERIIEDQCTGSATSVSIGVDYVPAGAKRLTTEDKILWDIEGQEFVIYYENSESLMNAFVDELYIKRKKKNELKTIVSILSTFGQ